MYRPSGGSTETQQMCDLAHTSHQVAALEHNRHVSRNAQASTWSQWKECQQMSLLPPRGARTQLAVEPSPLLCSPGTEHGCQMHCNAAERCVGLPRLSQDCDFTALWTKVPVPTHGDAGTLQPREQVYSCRPVVALGNGMCPNR